MSRKRAIVLVNIGTPASTMAEDVGEYLKEFLMDPEVLTLPFLLRWFLVHVLIVPKRKGASAEAYQKVWTEKGSPLLFLSQSFAEKLDKHLGSDGDVFLAMRYGEPSLPRLWDQLEAYRDVQVVPLFPQWARATSGSVENFARHLHRQRGSRFELSFAGEFFDHPLFIQALVKSLSDDLGDFDHMLFSYHGLPESHIRRDDVTQQHCLQSPTCCDEMVESQRRCYRAQCFATTRGVAREMNLGRDQYSVSFQSRLGRTPWIQPYTDVVVHELAARGVKKLIVLCPAFLIDCLETLEEIGMSLREQFLQAGGEQFKLVPCLNDRDDWVRDFAVLLSKP